MKTKHLILTALLVVGFMMPNCGNCPLFEDMSAEDYYIDVIGLSLSNHDRRIKPSDTIPFDDYSLWLYYQTNRYAQKTKNNFHFGGFMNVAVACSPEEPLGVSKTEKLKTITITTVNDFDTLHLKGDTINELLTYVILI